MQEILIVTKQVLILFLMMGIGAILGKTGKVTAQGVSQMTYLLTRVATPCVIITSMMLDGAEENLGQWAVSFLLILVIGLVQIAASLLLFRRCGKAQRPVYQSATFYGNAAFMGVALMQSILGESAVIYATFIMILDTIFMYTHMPLVMADEGRSFPVKKILINPGTLSFAVGLVLLLLNIRPPEIAMSVMNIMKGMNMPLAMVIVGVQISAVDIRKAFTNPDYYKVALVKLVIWPVILLAVLRLLPISTLALCAIIICKATAQPATFGAFVEMYGQDGEAASQSVALTTILSIVTLPIVAGICRMLID